MTIIADDITTEAPEVDGLAATLARLLPVGAEEVVVPDGATRRRAGDRVGARSFGSPEPSPLPQT